MPTTRTELLSPAGGFDAALAAFQYGADAVYLGLPKFSARADADNLTPERLRVLLAYAKTFSPAKKIYVTFNTVVQEAELPAALDSLAELDDLGPDGLIVQDLGIASLVRKNFPRLALHASTQLAAHSLEGVLALKELGFTRVVLARELTLAEIKSICAESGVEIEIFVHGALCYSVSGLCLFSSHTQARSGNRGRCAYCCRELFDGRYPFSMRDLAFAPILDEVVATGAASLKIEGRMKSPLYVACVTDYYRKKLDHCLTPEQDAAMVQDLQTIFSRPWTQLYAKGADAAPESVIDPVGMGHRGALIGTSEPLHNTYGKGTWLRFKTNRPLERHDGIQVDLPQGGRPFGCAIDTLRRVGGFHPEISVPAGTTVEISLPADAPQIPAGSPVFCSASQAVKRRYEIHSLRESELPAGKPIAISVHLAPTGMTATLENGIDASLALALTPARQPERTQDAVRKAFERMGDTAWRLASLKVDDGGGLYAPPSKLNDLRRLLLQKADEAETRRAAELRNRLHAALSLKGREAPQHALTVLKFRAAQTPPDFPLLGQADEIVLNIGHTAAAELLPQLQAWRAAAGQTATLRLALPIFTRNGQASECEATLASLLQDGWDRWEAAELSGCRRLRRLGVKTMTADWSLYAFNHVAMEELAALGVERVVLSPENGHDNFSKLAAAPLPAELPIFQHTPLFFSVTRPCANALADGQTEANLASRGRAFSVEQIDGIWITTLQAPFCLAGLTESLPRFAARRIDFSWSPAVTDIDRILGELLKGCPPADIRTANFNCGLA